MKSRFVQYIVLSVAMLTLLCGVVVASDAQISKQRTVVANLEKQLSAGEKEIANLRKNRADTEKRVESLVRQIETRNRLLKLQRSAEEQVRGEIKALDKSALQLNVEIAHHRASYSDLVREAYRNYSGQSMLSYLFSAQDFMDMARRVANMRAVALLRESYITQIDSLSRVLSGEKKVLQSKQSELNKIVRSLESQRTSLQRDVNSARANIQTLSTKERNELRESELRKRQLDAAVKELQKLIRDNKAGSSFSSSTANLNLPVQGGRVKLYKDNMAEVVGAAGAKVIAIYDAKVVDVKVNRITGKYDIYLAHGEYITSYSGLSSVSVAKDQVVTRNSVVGIIGESVDIITLQSEHKIVFGIYPPAGKAKVTAKSIFTKR
ncbi:MAG: peptidoglycan DD-metalloendopeptidase family protein [Rikenellaceae bacterium]